MTKNLDGNAEALRQHEARQDRADRDMEIAESERTQLIDAHIQGMSDADLCEVISELGSDDFENLRHLFFMCRAVGGDPTLSGYVRRSHLACYFSDAVHAKVNLLRGDELVEKRAQEIAWERNHE